MIKLLRKLIAFIRRTFVADCPKCHKHFYGFHDWIEQIMLDKHYRYICHRCAKEHSKRKKDV